MWKIEWIIKFCRQKIFCNIENAVNIFKEFTENQIFNEIFNKTAFEKICIFKIVIFFLSTLNKFIFNK